MRWEKMTKDEFLSILNNELENLERELQAAKQKADYFQQIDHSSFLPALKETQEAEYQYGIFSGKVGALRKSITFYAYERIQVMSDAEIDEYKKEKVNELELKIREIEIQEEQAKTKLDQLREEQDQLIAQFGNLSGDERDRIIRRGQQLSEEIRKYDVNVFPSLKRKIEGIKEQQEQIKTMISQEIKQQLLSEIDQRDLSAIESSKYRIGSIDATTKLQSSVASDLEKAQQMADLLTEYKRLSKETSEKLYPVRCPNIIKERLGDYYDFYLPLRYYGDGYAIPAPELDGLMENVKKIESSFKEEKTIFEEQFTEQKLSRLFAGQLSNWDPVNPEVDIELLWQHIDKLHAGSINDSELEDLQKLAERRDKLSKKIFKRKKTKEEIKALNDQIKSKQNKMFDTIICEYKKQLGTLLGEKGKYHPSNLDYMFNARNMQAGKIDIREILRDCKQDIDFKEKAITEFREDVAKSQEDLEHKKQNNESRMAVIAEQIRTLGGEEYKDVDLSFASDSYEENLRKITSAQSDIELKNAVDRALSEAQRQADIKEAELRGITVEELMQMRKQENTVEEQRETEEEEISQGIRR